MKITLDPLFVLETPRSLGGPCEDLVIAEVNAAALEWSNRPRDGVVGELLSAVLPPELFVPLFFRCLRVFETRLPLEEEVRCEGPIPRWEVRIAPTSAGVVLVFRPLVPRLLGEGPREPEADQMRASLKEKETLLKEIHHRVKNNLQVIASLLNLQAAHVSDPDAYEMFQESQNRVRSIALFHEKLYQSRDLVRIDMSEYLRDLVTSVTGTFGPRASRVEMMVDAERVLLDVESAVPCGLIANELITNSLKHAFVDGGRGHVRALFGRTADDSCELTVEDDGKGLPERFDLASVRSLGLRIVSTLTEQLGGKVEVERGENGIGTRFRVTFRGA